MSSDEAIHRCHGAFGAVLNNHRVQKPDDGFLVFDRKLLGDLHAIDQTSVMELLIVGIPAGQQMINGNGQQIN